MQARKNREMEKIRENKVESLSHLLRIARPLQDRVKMLIGIFIAGGFNGFGHFNKIQEPSEQFSSLDCSFSLSFS